jgi:hypothetical protein
LALPGSLATSSAKQDLTQLLADASLEMTGITLVAALGISSDGQFICGAATTPTTDLNGTAGFIAQIPAP